MLQKNKQSAGLSTWLADLTARKRKQVATVAMANKMARMVWAVLTKGEAYRPPLLPQPAEVLADDACQTTGLEIATRFPHPQTSYCG